MAPIHPFTDWATQMVCLLEDGKLDQGRWFARVNSVLAPQNLRTWRMQRGEREVNDGIGMLRKHVHEHWRPSWYDIAGSLRPPMESSKDSLPSSTVAVEVSATDVPVRAPSPDAMEVDPGFVNANDSAINRRTTPTDQDNTEHMSSPIVHNKSETGPRVNLLRPIIEIQQPNHPVRLQAPAPVSQKGPMTRRRCRDRNVRHFVESVTAIDHVQATNRNEATTRTGHGTTPKGQVAPRRPVRKRQGSLGAPARTQPKRGARKKSTQEQIPPIRIPALSQTLQGAITADIGCLVPKDPLPEAMEIDIPMAVSSSNNREPQSEGFRAFENKLGFAVLRDKVKRYERSVVSMIAEKEWTTETIDMKAAHIHAMQEVLKSWATTTNTERRRFGEYYTQEDIEETLLGQAKLLKEMRGSHNRLGYEIEVGRLRVSMIWELIEAAKQKDNEV